MKRSKKKPAPKGRGRTARKPVGLKANSLAMQAYEQIKTKIITLHFLPGQYLNESALCEALGLGRTPVHQALQRLQVEGLVEIMPRKGIIVQPDSISEILRILDSRAAVEAELARNAAQCATLDDAKQLLLLVSAKNGNDSAGLEDFINSDRLFHARIGDLSGNPVLSNFARSLHERSIRYWYLHLWQTLDAAETVRQHRAIAEYIANRDGDGAAEAVRAHIESLRKRLIRSQSASRGR